MRKVGRGATVFPRGGEVNMVFGGSSRIRGHSDGGSESSPPQNQPGLFLFFVPLSSVRLLPMYMYMYAMSAVLPCSRDQPRSVRNRSKIFYIQV